MSKVILRFFLIPKNKHASMQYRCVGIADVAVRKHYQRLDEILILLIPGRYWKSVKVFVQENSVGNVRIYSKRVLYETCASIESMHACVVCELDFVNCLQP